MAADRRIKVSRRTHISLIWAMTIVVVFMSCVVARRPEGRLESRPVSPDAATVCAVEGLELPYFDDSLFIVANRAGRYTLLYDTAARQASWVAYVLTGAECTDEGVGRSDRFVPDPDIMARRWPTARTGNYTRSGYDRGHLLPSADRNATREENRTTFYLSNIAPQHPSLNRGVWKQLEEKTREWAGRYDTLYVVTGTLTDDIDLRRIGGGVTVPDSFYKAILMQDDGVWYAVAFLMPNIRPQHDGWDDYMMTVRQLEDSSGMDFFHRLPRGVADAAESRADRDVWY